jgi:hypothetical protein
MHEKNEKCSRFLALKKLEMKIMLRFYLTLVRMASIKTQTSTNVGQDVIKKEF